MLNGDTMKLYEVEIPMPPTTNNLFVNLGRKRVKSKEYVAWIKEAGFFIREAPKLVQPVKINYFLTMRNGGSGDLSNRLKAIEDLLVKKEVIPDDNHKIIPEFSVKFAGYDSKNPRVWVEVWAS